MKRYIPLTDEEVWSFLRQEKLMAIATVDAEGHPHNTPVWYVVEDHKIYFRAAPSKAKISNIKLNPRVSCTVYAGDKYTELKGISFQATSRIITDINLYNRINDLLLAKYRHQRNYEAMPPQWRRKFEFEQREIVELTPTLIYSWDNSKWLQRNPQTVRVDES